MITSYLNRPKTYKVITSHKSVSRKNKYVDVIVNEPTSNKTKSAAILLNDRLSKLEVDSLIEEVSGSVRGRLKNFKKRYNIKNPKKIKKLMITFNNEHFLEVQHKRTNGNLRCEYCFKPVRIYNIDSRHKFRESDGATADHKVPISLGGEKYDFENLATCCYRCNQRKSNMPWEQWKEIVPSLEKYQ